MLAMFTPASPKSVPTQPDHARHVVVAEEDHQRRELHLELEAERVHEPVPVLVADDRARHADLVAVRRISTRTRFVKSRLARRRSSATSIPRSAATSGAFT